MFKVGLVTTGGFSPWCGGSIISTKHVLTAAHCTKDKFAPSIEVLVGEHDVGDTEADRRAVASISDHPEFNIIEQQFDISILTLVSALTFTSAVAPICLPASIGTTNYENTYSEYSNYGATVTGWGLTATGGTASNTLQEVELTILTNSACEEAWGSQIKR